MEINPVVALALLWALIGLLRRGSQAGSSPSSPPRPRPTRSPDSSRTSPRPSTRSEVDAAPTGKPRPDATQREGSRLEDLFREAARSREAAAAAPAPRTGPAGKPKAVPRSGTDARRRNQGGRASRPTEEPVVVSRERETARPERSVVDQDDMAADIVARRIAAAAARNRALTPEDHQAFDRRIRAEHDTGARRKRTPDATRRLRDALVWREILGPPVGLQDASEMFERRLP